MYERTGRRDEALVLLKEKLEITRSTLGEGHAEFIGCLNNTAAVHWSMGNLAEAERLFRQSLDISRELLGENNRDHASGLRKLARLLCQMERYEEAESLLLHALDILRRMFGETDADCAFCLDALSVIYDHTDRRDDGSLLRQEAEKICGTAWEKEPASGCLISPLVRSRYSETVSLILDSASANNEERQYWINILPIMTPEQIQDLHEILENERKQLREIGIKSKEDFEEIERIGQEELRKVMAKTDGTAGP